MSSLESELKEKKSVVEVVPRKRVIVAGMGPGGITAAIEAHKKGYEVIIFDNRDHFTRPQRIFLNGPTLSYLIGLGTLPEDEEFLTRLNDERSITIDRLQTYLQKKLKSHLKEREGIGNVRMGSEHEILEFDLSNEQNVLVVRNKEKEERLRFDYFVAADGAKRNMAEKLNQAYARIAKTQRITYKDLETQTRQVPHGTVSLRVKPSVSKKTEITLREIGLQDLLILKELGWDEPFPPKSHVLCNKERTQFYIAGEIPQKILDSKGDEQTKLLTEWGKMIIKLQLKVQDAEDRMELDINADEKVSKENQLKATVFEVRLKYTETPCLQLSNDAFFVSIGDATMNANLHLGHGGNDAIADGRKFAEYLPSVSETSAKFNQRSFIRWRRDKKETIRESMALNDEEDMRVYKAYIPKINKEIIKYGEYLLMIAKPLEQFDESLKKRKDEFEVLLKNIKDTPKAIIFLDDIYQKTLEFTDAINDGFDKKMKAEKEKIKAELALVQLSKCAKGIVTALTSVLCDRSEYWKNERARLDSEEAILMKKLKEQEEYEKRLSSLKTKTGKLLKKTPTLYQEYLKKLREKTAPATTPTPTPESVGPRKPKE